MPAPRLSPGLLLAAALLAATLANGIGPWLKRVGWLEAEGYRAFWTTHCAIQALDDVDEWQCGVFTTPAAIRHQLASPFPPKEQTVAHVYALGPVGAALKLAKDGLWLALLAVCAWRVLRAAPLPGRTGGGDRPLGAALLLLALDTLLGLGLALAGQGPTVALAGLRGMLFLPLALLGRPLAVHLPAVAAAVALLLALQLALAPPELVWGMHMFREWTPWSWASRLIGTLTQPSSLGIFAVAAWAFFLGFQRGLDRWRRVVAGLALALVLLSGSGTAALCAAALLLSLLLRRVPAAARPWLLAAAAAVLLAAFALLPLMPSREDIHASLLQRLDTVHAALFARPLADVLFGSGLGWNTNAALALGRPGLTGLDGPISTDSALLSLVLQLGVLGAALFCAVLAAAARRDAAARGFYAVIAVAVLTSNVTELFPVNLLLALVLAHSLWGAPPARA